jgi:hypothetical protein
MKPKPIGRITPILSLELTHYLKKADLHEADLQGANLYGMDLREANLQGANLYGTDLREADFHRANLQYAYLYGANLKDAKGIGVDLQEAHLYGTDLRKADLSEADLWGANLQGANLHKANLTDAKGIVCLGTDPRGCRFVGVQHRGAISLREHRGAISLREHDDGWWISAGCRWFTLDKAKAHWANNNDVLARINTLSEKIIGRII